MGKQTDPINGAVKTSSSEVLQSNSEILTVPCFKLRSSCFFLDKVMHRRDTMNLRKLEKTGFCDVDCRAGV